MCTLFENLYVLLTWGPHMVYMGTPYIFDIYMIRCGWLCGINRRCCAQFKYAQTVVGQRFAGNSPDGLSYYYYYIYRGQSIRYMFIYILD